MRKKYNKKNKRLNHPIFSLWLLFFIVFSLTILAFYQFEKKMIPSLQQISHMRTRTLANSIVDDALTTVMKEMPLTTEDFITTTEGITMGYSANTQIINEFCTKLNQKINESMMVLPEEKILIPIGAASNLNIFANFGPQIPFSLLPAGAVSSDYETSFVAAGINQLNYKIWINVSLDIQIVNPLYREKINLTKKIMLVDTIIGAEVPDYYFNMGEKMNGY